MAGQEGFEPPTPGFGVRRSSRSSYWPAGVVFSITGFVPSGIKGYWKVGILGPKKCATTKNVLFPLFTPTIIIIPWFHMLGRDKHNQKCWTINNLPSSLETKPPHPNCIHPIPPSCHYSVQLEQVRPPSVAEQNPWPICPHGARYDVHSSGNTSGTPTFLE